jgi:hypothetical protein
MRVTIGLVALCLLADFLDPGFPGAFHFNPSGSVEVVQAQQMNRTARLSAVELPVKRSPGDVLGAATPLAKPVVAYAAPVSRRWRTRVFRPTVEHHASEEPSPASLAA